MKVIVLLVLLFAVAVIAQTRTAGTTSGATGTSGGSGTTGTSGIRLGNSKLRGRARSGIAAPTLNNYDLYAIGGTISDDTSLNDVDKYSIVNNTWRAVAPLAINRNAPGAAGLDGYLYVFGGLGDNLVPLTSGERYNPETDSWTTWVNLNSRRWNLGAVQLCTEIYAIGGFDFQTFNASNLIQATSTVEVYSVLTGSWRFTTSLPEPRAAFGTVVLNNEIWVIGGTTQFLTGTGQSPLITSVIFNTTSATWRQGPSLRQSRVGFGAVVIDNKIFIAGGRTVAGDLITEVEFYDPYAAASLGFQSAGFSVRTARFNNAVGSIANTLFLIGGRVSNGNAFSFTNVVEPIAIIS